jgi:hypothetical protein
VTNAGRAALAVVATLTLSGCAEAAPFTKLPRVTQREWDRGRAALAAARAELPKEPYTLVVAVDMVEPYTGRTFTARGGLAVMPGRAVRLQLLGPGGSTALDAWLSRERFRFDVPAVDVHKRGAIDGPEAAGLPVGFFRFWFLSQLEGRLLFAKPTREGTYFVLRDGDATVEMFRATHGGHVEAERVEKGRLSVEELSVTSRGARPGAGDVALYRSSFVGVGARRTPGLVARVRVESIGDEAPDPEAFVEPSP